MNLSDQDTLKKIVEGCAKGDRYYQQQLYKAMYSQMMAVCHRYAARSEDAKDLFQEGFIKVFDKIGRYNFKGSLQGWIRRIMVNNAIDHYRKNKNKFSMSESMMEAERIQDEEIDESIFADITADQLLNCVQELSPMYKSVFNMYVLDGYTHSEIAIELNISEGTSKSNLSKAKRNLKQMVLELIENEKETAK